MKKIFSSTLFLGLALGLGSAAYAQDNSSQDSTPNTQQKIVKRNRAGKMDGEGQGNGAGVFAGINKLNLTAAQKQQIKALRQERRLDQSTVEERRQLMQAKRNGDMLTREQQNRLKTLRQQAKADNEKVRQQILAILTPEQRQQFEQNNAGKKGNRQNKMMQDQPQDN